MLQSRWISIGLRLWLEAIIYFSVFFVYKRVGISTFSSPRFWRLFSTSQRRLIVGLPAYFKHFSRSTMTCYSLGADVKTTPRFLDLGWLKLDTDCHYSLSIGFKCLETLCRMSFVLLRQFFTAFELEHHVSPWCGSASSQRFITCSCWFCMSERKLNIFSCFTPSQNHASSEKHEEDISKMISDAQDFNITDCLKWTNLCPMLQLEFIKIRPTVAEIWIQFYSSEIYINTVYVHRN